MSRVKIAERIVFFCFLFRVFSIFERYILRRLAKNFKSFQNYFLRVQRNSLCLYLFLNVLNRYGFSAETFGMVLEILSTCPDKKCGENSLFLFSFQNFFSDFERKFSDFWPKNVNNLSKLPSTCPEGQFVAGFFLKFWIVSDFLQKPLAWFSKFFLRVQSKNCGKNSFFLLLFGNCSIFERKFFRFLAKKLQKIVKTSFCVSRGTTCGFKSS